MTTCRRRPNAFTRLEMSVALVGNQLIIGFRFVAAYRILYNDKVKAKKLLAAVEIQLYIEF